jgi:DNA mismatch endonuclease (patch repair protein)
MDNLTKKQRKKCMSKIASKDTKPEILARKALTEKGIRYRLHVKKLFGKPDIVIRKLNLVIFINGCFWHQHENCKYSVMPKRNKSYWKPKLERNIEKQKKDIEKLKKEGWDVKVIWECELKNYKLAKQKIEEILP